MFENVVCEMAAILSRPQCVNSGNGFVLDGTKPLTEPMFDFP